MESSQYSSKLLDDAVTQFSRLPGIGKKTALRLVLHLLREDKDEVAMFTEAIRAVRNDIHYCRQCHNLSDSDTCEICANPRRDHRQVCVVETVRDVMAIEATRQYAGVYHVLGGVISPMDGIGPDDLNIDSLEARVSAGDCGRGDIGPQHYNGGRHDQLLYLQAHSPIWDKDHHHCARRGRGRRAGVC